MCFERQSPPRFTQEIDMGRQICSQFDDPIFGLMTFENQASDYRKEKIQKSIIDKGVLSERKDSFIPLYIHLKEEYLKMLIKNSNPTNPSFKILVYD